MLYYEESGDKNAPAILFIHGGGISGWMWKRQTASLMDFHCIVPDLPEHGKSIGEGVFTITDAADRLAELIKMKAAGGKAHVVGHSIGAKIIVELLSRHPDVVDHAVVVSALFRPMPYLTWTFNRFFYGMTVRMLRNKRILDYQVRQFGFCDPSDRKNLANDFKFLTVDSLDHVYGELYRHLILPGNLDKAQAHTLVIAGMKEPKAMRESAGDIAKALPSGKGALFQGCRHDIPWKAPDAFNRTIREWINDMPLSSQCIQPLDENHG